MKFNIDEAVKLNKHGELSLIEYVEPYLEDIMGFNSTIAKYILSSSIKERIEKEDIDDIEAYIVKCKINIPLEFDVLIYSDELEEKHDFKLGELETE